MFSTITSGAIILTQVVLPLVLSHYMGVVSLILQFEYGIEMVYVNLTLCALRYISINCFISSNGEYDVIAKEINNSDGEKLYRPEI